MDKSKYYKFLSQDISNLKGVGKKIKIFLKRKKIEKISDLLWNLPISFIGIGEKMDDLIEFDTDDYLKSLINSNEE